MEHTAIWIVVYLLTGTPVPITRLLPDATICNDDLALNLARAWASDEKQLIMDEVLWRCFPIPYKEPAPPIQLPDVPLVQKKDL